MKKIFKRIGYAIIGTALALNAGCTKIMNPDEYMIESGNLKARPFAKWCFDFQISKPVREVSNVPESFRNVPVHSDDWGYGGVIEDDSAKLPPLIDIGFLKGGLETKIGDIGVDVYADLSFNASYFLPLSHDPWCGEVNERNYKGAPGTDERGYGTALTYWTANYAPVLIPGLKCDLILPINEDVDFIVGGGVRDYELQAERGWDRYNSLDKKDHLRIADMTEKSIYIGFRSFQGDSVERRGGAILKLGFNYYDYDKEVKSVEIDGHDKSFFILLGGEWLF